MEGEVETMSASGRLIMLGGPSCVGKGPLCAALKSFFPELGDRLHQLVLYNTRGPRPGEKEGVDYYFRSRPQLEELSARPGFIVMDVRGDLQGLELAELQAILASGRDAFFEGNPFVPQALWSLPELSTTPMLKIFLAPLARQEILWLKSQGAQLPEMLTDIMRRKLLRRTQKQKGILSQPDLANIEKRAMSAPLELQLAWQFDYVIPNHDGEDHENWNAFYYPTGDALRALLSLAAILQGEKAPYAEQWEEGLWPGQ
jgi:guanylate kinase